ncbi:MAG TPA: NADH-quinone oxidoreductase subunit C [Herpetosiphonaceae bacterium]
MSLLSKGELRAILERDLPGVIAPPLRPTRTNGHGSHQQDVQEDAAETTGDTTPAPRDSDSAAAKGAKSQESHRPLPQLNDDDAVVVAERLPEVLSFMRERLGYQYLSHITAVDYLEYGVIEVIYHLFRIEGGPGQMVRVRAPRENPVIPSITPIWPGANLQEREAWDLYGVQFPGHPYHKRVYMWEEFEGHPMRKDFEKIGDAYYHFKWKGEEEEE